MAARKVGRDAKAGCPPEENQIRHYRQGSLDAVRSGRALSQRSIHSPSDALQLSLRGVAGGLAPITPRGFRDGLLMGTP